MLIADLEKANTLSMNLQKKDLDIVSAAHLVEQVTCKLIQMRDDGFGEHHDVTFTATWDRAAQFIGAYSQMATPGMAGTWARRGVRCSGEVDLAFLDRMPSWWQNDILRRRFRSEVFKSVVRDMIQELQSRFSGKMTRLMGHVDI